MGLLRAIIPDLSPECGRMRANRKLAELVAPSCRGQVLWFWNGQSGSNPKVRFADHPSEWTKAAET
jgi:hypothetical protein